ncbi:DUF1775 domain-containing protein [Pseudolabrys sp. Root1462]|jgi:uncharacterized protein YcnI|uniref:YcnI family copper-binding membrane protein n=1 Tax=Pseudolabrys sp. Root1462 TaxID=1736466 RepID=UPI0009EB92EA|nr:DUF1775 domain-containing protein [Pseudolabrys sp. Root1462]
MTNIRWRGRMPSCAFVAVLSLSTFNIASAHVTLDKKEVAIGSFYKAVLTVPHGCDGSPTVKIAVQIPEGVISVKPMVKPGWTIEIKRGAYAKPYSFLHGAKFTEGPKEIVWSGGALPDGYFDEFILQTFVAGELTPGTTLYFPVTQTCQKGEHRWVQVPSAGKPDEHLGEPAPAIKLIPAASKGH